MPVEVVVEKDLAEWVRDEARRRGVSLKEITRSALLAFKARVETEKVDGSPLKAGLSYPDLSSVHILEIPFRRPLSGLTSEELREIDPDGLLTPPERLVPTVLTTVGEFVAIARKLREEGNELHVADDPRRRMIGFVAEPVGEAYEIKLTTLRSAGPKLAQPLSTLEGRAEVLGLTNFFGGNQPSVEEDSELVRIWTEEIRAKIEEEHAAQFDFEPVGDSWRMVPPLTPESLLPIGEALGEDLELAQIWTEEFLESVEKERESALEQEWDLAKALVSSAKFSHPSGDYAERPSVVVAVAGGTQVFAPSKEPSPEGGWTSEESRIDPEGLLSTKPSRVETVELTSAEDFVRTARILRDLGGVLYWAPDLQDSALRYVSVSEGVAYSLSMKNLLNSPLHAKALLDPEERAKILGLDPFMDGKSLPSSTSFEPDPKLVDEWVSRGFDGGDPKKVLERLERSLKQPVPASDLIDDLLGTVSKLASELAELKRKVLALQSRQTDASSEALREEVERRVLALREGKKKRRSADDS